MRRTPLRRGRGRRDARALARRRTARRRRSRGRRSRPPRRPSGDGAGPAGLRRARSVDPAHLVPRSLGGCDHAHCVVALCRAHHRAYDRGELDLVPSSSRPPAEAAHAVAHLGLVGACGG